MWLNTNTSCNKSPTAEKKDENQTIKKEGDGADINLLNDTADFDNCK